MAAVVAITVAAGWWVVVDSRKIGGEEGEGELATSGGGSFLRRGARKKSFGPPCRGLAALVPVTVFVSRIRS